MVAMIRGSGRGDFLLKERGSQVDVTVRPRRAGGSLEDVAKGTVC